MKRISFVWSLACDVAPSVVVRNDLETTEDNNIPILLIELSKN